MFVPKTRAYKILRNKIEDVVQESKMVWKKVFGVMPTDVEEEEKYEGGVELDNKEDIYNNIERLVETIKKMTQESVKQIETITIADDTPDNTLSNVTIVDQEPVEIVFVEPKKRGEISKSIEHTLMDTNPMIV